MSPGSTYMSNCPGRIGTSNCSFRKTRSNAASLNFLQRWWPETSLVALLLVEQTTMFLIFCLGSLTQNMIKRCIDWIYGANAWLSVGWDLQEGRCHSPDCESIQWASHSGVVGCNSLFSQPRPSICQSWCTDPHDRSCFDSWLSSPVLIESYYWNLVMEKHILQTNTANSSNIVTYIFDPDPHVRPIMGPPACRSRFRRHMNRFLSQLERAGRYLSLGWIDGDGGTRGELHKWSLQPSSLSQVLGL